jgi:predicted peptidase
MEGNMGKWILSFLPLVVLCMVLPAQAADPAEFIVWSTAQLPGRLYVPPTYNPAQQYPLILFLHGGGERGNDNVSQVNQNIDHLFTEAKRRQAILYAPQLLEGASWAAAVTATGSATQNRIQQMLTLAKETYNVDSSRLYITGLSLGGGGTWDIMARYDNQFAAGVPICGTGGATLYRPGLVDQPLWAYHARNDQTVSVTNTRGMMNTILAGRDLPPLEFLPTSNVSDMNYARPPHFYTEYGTGGHSVWFRAYQDAAMYDWLFEQRIPEPCVAWAAGILVCLMRRPSAAARRCPN